MNDPLLQCEWCGAQRPSKSMKMIIIRIGAEKKAPNNDEYVKAVVCHKRCETMIKAYHDDRTAFNEERAESET